MAERASRARPRPGAERLVPEIGSRAARGTRRRYLVQPAPWGRRDAVVPGVLAFLGALGVAICWVGASHEAAFRDQIAWTVGAFTSFGLFALAGGLWVLVGFRRTRLGILELQADADAVFDLESVRRGPTTSEPTGPAGLVTAPGMALAHRPECLLMQGKQMRPLDAHEFSTYQTCTMCATGS